MERALEVKAWIGIAGDFLIRQHDFLDLDVDKIIVRVEVLLHQAADLQKCR
jgi:hypothetical protein